MIPLRRRWLAIPLALILVLFIQAPSVAAEPLAIEADTLELSTDGRLISATGHVTLTYLDIVLRAASVVYEGDTVKASGMVELITENGHLFAERLDLNLKTRGLSAASVHGLYADLAIRADLIDSMRQGEGILGRAGVTRCDLGVPCYELRAGRIIISGRKITVERGWLALKGLTLLPLPRLTLDLDRVEDWPRLSARFETLGLVLGAELTVPTGEASSLVFQGEAATGGLLSLRPSYVWQPTTATTIELWGSLSTREGSSAGIDAAFAVGGAPVALAMRMDWRLDLVAGEMSAVLSSWELAAGRLNLTGFWNRTVSRRENERTEAGVSIRWSERGPEDKHTLALVLGREWRGRSPLPLVRIEAGLNDPIASDWSWDTEFRYDVTGRAWLSGKVGFTRRLHCYFLRLGYDWIDASVALNAGLTF
ncbi:MAG: hypothetical protein ACM3ZC_11175 [Bacteroidota bacterium]